MHGDATLNPIYVSYFTENYREEADALIGTLKRFDLEYDVAKILDTGSWVGNCSRKASFIAAMMGCHRNRPVVWVDADARIRRYPILLDGISGDVDVAYHLRNEQELLSGTLYFAPTDMASKVVRNWWLRCDYSPHRLDQELLAEAVRIYKPNVQHLPACYVRIFDADDQGPDIVIEHMQASRRMNK